MDESRLTPEMRAFLALPEGERNALIDESIAEMAAQTARISALMRREPRPDGDHAQVALPDPDDPAATVEVDAGIAPLISALWARGFRTTSSCEGRPGGYAYVALWPYDAAPAVLALLPVPLRAMVHVDGEVIRLPAAAVPDVADAMLAAAEGTHACADGWVLGTGSGFQPVPCPVCNPRHRPKITRYPTGDSDHG